MFFKIINISQMNTINLLVQSDFSLRNLGPEFKGWLIDIGLNAGIANFIKVVAVLIVIAVMCILANYIAKKLILTILERLVKKSKTNWDDILLEKKVFNRLSHFAPAIVLYYMIDYVIVEKEAWVTTIQSGTYLYMIVISVLVLNSFLNSVNEIYNTFRAAKNRSIKGFLQVAKILLFFVAGIMTFSIIMDKSPLYFLAGLGTIAAILLLIFKDSILGLVAGIQLAANDMVRPGDWISMPSKGADGEIIDISLNTVKVQNWDKTISTIPTYSLVSESFNNWRGMEESGGRRIKRSINIDIKSVKFCDNEMFEKFEKISLIKDYVKKSKSEVDAHNSEKGLSDDSLVNGRRLTNIGTFRKYLEFYLEENSNINSSMTFIIRQLQPTEKGVPIEIYVFSKVQAWAEYEAIQADIFDHVFAVIPEFDLSVFQNPTGDDFRQLM